MSAIAAQPHWMPEPERIVRDCHQGQRAIDALLREWRIATDIKTPLPLTGDVEVDIKLEVQRRADILWHAAQSDEHKWYWIDEVRESFWTWRNNFCWVLDDRRNRKVPYLAWEFHDELQAAYLGLTHNGVRYLTPLGDRYFIACAKSREMGGTVAVAAPMVWEFQVKPDGGSQFCVGYRLANVAQRNKVWTSSTFSKLRCMIDWMPRWMLQESWRYKTRRFVDKERILIEPDRGIAIEAETSDVESIRSKRAVRVWFDEANSIPHLDAAIGAAQKVGPICMTSSVTHRGTHFARLWHGDLIQIATPGETGGILPLRIHYTQHPKYNPKTAEGRARIAEEKAGMTAQRWSEEMEIDFSATSVGRIWSEYFKRETHVLTREEVSELMPFLHEAMWIEAWDFGENKSHTTWLLGAYFPEDDELYIMHYRSWEDELIDEVVKSISSEVYTNLSQNKRVPDMRVGDMMGKHSVKKMEGGRRMQVITQWRRDLEDWGVDVDGQILNVEGAIKLVSTKLRDGAIALMPSTAKARPEREDHPSVAEAIENYCRYIPKGMDPENYRGNTPKPSKDKYSHLADALQHMAYAIWRGTDTYKDACKRARGDR